MKLNDMKNLSKDDLLAALGLQTRPSALGAIMGTLGLVGIGALLGAGAALLWAPKPGHELRRELGDRINGATRRVTERVREEMASRQT